ncbi:hypothetical protein SORBI_3005G095620, partial [Sorghum bicolor]
DSILKITLWGDHALDFNIDNIYDPEAGNLIVCLIVGCTPREDMKDNGKTALTGSPACAYYFNPNITEARPFYNRFKNVPIYIQRPLEEETGSLVQEISLPEKTIAALDQIDPFNEEEPGPFKCAVTIVSITNATSWWYMSCRACKKKAEQQINSTYKCPRCQSTNTVPRYLLSFIGRDDTGDAKFFAYDDEASKMIQKDCDTLVNPLAPRDVLPRPLENIINKKFVLSVNLTDDSCKGNSFNLLYASQTRTPVIQIDNDSSKETSQSKMRTTIATTLTTA